MFKKLFVLVLVIAMQFVFAKPAAAAGGIPTIPPVTWSCYVSKANATNYVPATGDGSTALNAVNCPALAKSMADKVNKGIAVLNNGILFTNGSIDWSSKTIKALIKKMTK